MAEQKYQRVVSAWWESCTDRRDSRRGNFPHAKAVGTTSHFGWVCSPFRKWDESVQAPRGTWTHLFNRRKIFFQLKDPPFMQMRIPVVIPIAKALIAHKALLCNNCNERLVTKQTFHYPDWCEKCYESLWSTREMHSWQIRACWTNIGNNE